MTTENQKTPSLRSWRPRLGQWFLFGGPLLLWTLILVWSGAEGARYETSWRWTQSALRLLCPEFAPPGDPAAIQVDVTMYQINGALRRLAHVGAYAVLACLLIRLLQQGRPRLRRRSLVGAFLLSLLYIGGDELYRYFQPNRHAKWLDLYLNLAGAVCVLVGTVFWFAWKNWERQVTGEPRENQMA